MSKCKSRAGGVLRILACSTVLFGNGAAWAADGQPAASTAPEAAGKSEPAAEYMGDPKYQPAQPDKRGKERRPPGGIGNAEKFPIIWGWRLETPEGKGLAFGGMSIRTEDPRPETQVKRDGKWTPIHEELRKNNPLQAEHDQLAAMRMPLKRITALARHSYLEGSTVDAEKAFLDKEVAPIVAEFPGKLKEIRTSLAKAAGDDAYAVAQIAFAQGHLDKVLPAVEGLGSSVSSEKLAALRLARIHLEQAAEALDAAPPARALSMLAYDAQTGLFAIFGGDHLDYLTNDLWVFDPKAQKWRQRHPKNAPEPRAEHFLTSSGPGKLSMRGGYVYGRKNPGWDSSTYVNAGPEEWTYDLAADIWSGPADQPTFPRGYSGLPHGRVPAGLLHQHVAPGCGGA